MKKSNKRILSIFLSISMLFISAFSVPCYATTENYMASSPIVSVTSDGTPIIKGNLIETTSEYRKFSATFSSPTIQRDSVGTATAYATLFNDGTLEIEVQCTGWELMKSGSINGLKTYGVIGSRTYTPKITAYNFIPGPVLTFEHSFSGMSTYINGSQYVQVGRGSIELVNGSGSFSSFIAEFEV